MSSSVQGGIHQLGDALNSISFPKSSDPSSTSTASSEKGEGPPEDPSTGSAAAAAATAAAAASVLTDDEEEGTDPLLAPGNNMGEIRPSGQFMMLTKKLIEIRNILKTIEGNEALRLPSIVVIGSQSSGKSSVLEAIVGHEFLPKGTNMVTRRPIELTLVNAPAGSEEYGEFPQLGLGRIRDFLQIQSTLRDMNMAVSDEECISPKPIELRIHSPNVPDLTLVDLPGYIQVTTRGQPIELKSRIASLCETYIQEPNIILTVCPADVDLANSEALMAARRVDPLGLRTIGVISKTDLVPPEQAVSILENHDYPLLLGYVGVVCKAGGGRGGGKSGDAMVRRARDREEQYFQGHAAFHRKDLALGTGTLRRKLTEVLEEYMGRNLDGIVDAVQGELDESRYQYKVQYNDRRISAESYVADTMDEIKQSFKELTRQLDKPRLRSEVRALLEQRVMDISGNGRWKHRLDVASAHLTKSGVGRSVTQHIVDVLHSQLHLIAEAGNLGMHPATQERVMSFATDILRNKYGVTVNQVENTIKPFKFDIECTESEWNEGVKRARSLVEREMAMCEAALQGIKTSVGKRRLRAGIQHILSRERDMAARKKRREEAEEMEEPLEERDLVSTQYSPILLEKARETMALRQRMFVLRYRLAALKSKGCRTSSGKAMCPEAFLSVVAEKLTYTSVMFLQVELLNEFFFQFPREVDDRLYYDLDKASLTAFARENPEIRRQLDLLERRSKLEEVMEKLGYLARGRKESGSSAY
ncbi:P-loop containing nucleoside triphosphate hydrolase protein [Piptocephalis cylindrospora]|uniref:dynamin GTPase n=1 Tax=Piptocephalis cylindrospora TaxID=1907219 RepID=A0A4P9XZA1_9FUNG|nr:P-loop containing nucleoside triphosphate hydrolase protein [Piptocephalis cylindrospora]|eukprot:RKP11808.1 P-loop containing nucleoside triphosphate hydrolase protein [Piptocephalis cylindrospora]